MKTIHAVLFLAATLAFSGTPANAQLWTTEQWTATWGSAPAPQSARADVDVFNNQTLRLVIRTSVGGTRVRVRVSNESGSAPLRIGAARVALRAAGSDIAVGSDRALTFSGQAGITIAAGAPALSDPVELNVPPLSDLAVSLYLPGEVRATIPRDTAHAKNYVSLAGNFTAASTLPVQRTISSCPILTTVDVQASGPAIVALGDSITAGANHGWPGWLARRMQAGRDAATGVVNRAIGGSRLLGDASNPPAAPSIVERFDRDVLSTAGVKFVALMVGINDIGHSSPANPVSVDDIVAGYRQVIARAHARGIAVYGATLTPFEGAGYYSPGKEAMRQAVNAWIRSSGEFDGVIDFDQAMRDPARPSRFLPAYDSGDHLHPNDFGYQAMGDAVPLALFKAPAAKLALYK